MDIQFFSVLRAVHILVAALWLGAGALLTLIVFPAIRQTGASGGAVMAEAVRRGLVPFMASIGGLTIVSGLLLYWVWVGASGALGMHSRGGIVLLFGALAGIIAAIIGGAVLGRGSKQMAALATSTDAARETQIAALHSRMASASKFVLALLVIALLLMVFSHFV
jgi:hypothetical protein